MGIKISNKEDKTYVVLGVPHSATSFTTKALKDQGINFKVNTRDVYQDIEFVILNERILSKAGGSWYNPPSEEKILAVEYDINIKRYIESRKDKFWGCKDPRASLTIKKYLPHLDGDVYLICCFRKPEKVIESYKNEKHGEKVDKKLVDHYNKSIISAIKEFVGL